MCTSIYIKGKNCYFGRNMDIHYSFNEKVVFIPRNYCFSFKKEPSIEHHFGICGSGTIIDNYPLLSDGVNEKGLAFAGLNFLGNAEYREYEKNKLNFTPYEFVLYLLGVCSSVSEVKEKMKDINLLNIPFSREVPLAELHFMFSDLNESIVVESTKEGMKIYDNPFGVLTNNPEFIYHRNNVYNFLNLSIDDPKEISNFGVRLRPISYGQGAVGLPGDYSSQSRFIKALFVKSNLIYFNEEREMVNQFFYCLDSVLMPKGLVKVGNEYEYTRYSICYNLNKWKLYYKTYDNRSISIVDINLINKELDKLIEFSFQ